MTQQIQLQGGERYLDNAIELQNRPSTFSEESEDEDLYPESNRALLRKHCTGGDDLAVSMTEPRPSATQRLWNFMSRTPLLQKGSRATIGVSYAAIPSEDSSRHGSESQGEVSASKGKHVIRNKSTSIAALRGNESYVHSGSESQRSAPEAEGTSLPSFVDGIAAPVGDGTKLSEDVGPFLVEEEFNESTKSHDAVLNVDENPPDNSPFSQVRASVSATDNTSLSICTPRMWILSLFFAFLGSATNLFFSLRYPSVAITPIIALVLMHPLGRIWDFALKYDDDPNEAFEHGHRVPTLLEDVNDDVNDTWLRRSRLWLAQGKWNEKEHAMVYISSNVSFGFAFATDVQNSLLSAAARFLNQSRSLLNKPSSITKAQPSLISYS